MIDIVQAIIDWIKSLFGCDPAPERIKISGHCFMPLFVSENGRPRGTWEYLSLDESLRNNTRAQIKAGVGEGETPAICFCLTPSGVSGGLIDDKMLAVTDDALAVLETKILELIDDGIAIFGCLYTDGGRPAWQSIAAHRSVWRRVHTKIGHLVTGWILSIETNEAAPNVEQIRAGMADMRDMLPGADYYGTHLQWKAYNGKYVWNSAASTPRGADVILAEASWDPNKGDIAGVAGLARENGEMVRAGLGCLIVWHEYNITPWSKVGQEQRAYLRGQNVWGRG